ncbi:ABC transporter ATP-binding protein [Allofustis seminis]|uniref:ABC transporter ATP-binding protein n=1 Tax=Allofustis seminis TaxID=166939 RepID=UPI0003601036|nr:ABC transporter ATP-binding protein [Allofustis seminis]
MIKMEYAIEVHQLIKRYEDFTLGPIDLKVPKGYLIGYIGENGSGKSTTLKAILGLIQPDSGKITVFGNQVKDNPQLLNKIGVVFDNLFLPGEMKLKEVGKYCSLSFTTWQSKQFEEYLHQFKLSPNKKVKDLSRGMKMKLSLSIALSHQAELLILDEATSGLDPVVRDEILDILLEFLQNESHTVLISSHILSDLEKTADYIAFLHKGKLLFMEQKDQLIEEYGLCSVSNEAMKTIDPEAIVGKRSHAFGQELLVKRSLVPESMELSKPSIEDIMIFIIKGEV